MDINKDKIQFSYPAKNYIIQGILGAVLVPLTIIPIAFFSVGLVAIIVALVVPSLYTIGTYVAASIFIPLVLLIAWFFFARTTFKSVYIDKQNFNTSAIVFTVCGALPLSVLTLLNMLPLNHVGGGIPF